MPTIVVFIGAAVLEIAGCFAFWGWLRQHRSPWLAAGGIASLIMFAALLTRAEVAFAGRAYAAYGGIYVTASLVWLWAVERSRPDRWDLAGAALCIAGCAVILFGRR